jgi:hypothetical protein
MNPYDVTITDLDGLWTHAGGSVNVEGSEEGARTISGGALLL